MLYTALVTILALGMYFVLLWNVGRARGRYGIKAPAVTGNEDFERYYRVQTNTVEQFVLFLPSLWLFSFYVSDRYGAALGIIWIIGRALYAKGYYQEAAKRELGFMVGGFANLILLLGAAVGIVMALLRA